MMGSPEMNLQMDRFILQYLKKGIKKWLGNAKEVLVVYSEPVSDPVPLSICVRSVLEADGKKVDYVEQSDFKKAHGLYGESFLDIGLKTIIVENDEKMGSQVPFKIAKDVIKGPGHSNYDNIAFVSKTGVLSPEQAHSVYLANILSRKYNLF